MKRLLLPLIIALAFPMAVNAEGYHLILINVEDEWVERIPMASNEACEREKLAVMKQSKWSDPFGDPPKYMWKMLRATCVNGN